jgi:hypothetical protein
MVVEQGETYAGFIDSELKYEHERRNVMDARGLAVATTSSAFLALAVALTVFVTGKDYRFSEGGARGVLLSLASFVVAAVLGLVANATRPYRVADVPTLHAMTRSHWKDNEVTARNVCAGLSVTAIASLRAGSNRKAGLVVVAFIFQLAAIAGLVATLAYELRGAFGLS